MPSPGLREKRRSHDEGSEYPTENGAWATAGLQHSPTHFSTSATQTRIMTHTAINRACYKPRPLRCGLLPQ